MLRHDGEQVGWGLALSLGLHLLLALFIILWPGLGKSRHQSFAPVYRVNLVGAPRLAPPRAAAPPAAKPVAKPAAVKPKPRSKPQVRTRPKPSPKPKEAIGSKKLKAKKLKPKRPAQDLRRQERLLDRKLKRLEARVRQERTLESALSRLERKVASRSGVYASSAATPAAGAAAGAGGGQVSLRMQVYYTELWERIRRAWILPAARVEDTRGLTASVVMRLNRDGSLEKVYLEKSSGNPAYDRSCLRAVEKAAPFPPFPAGINQRSLEVGVNFHSEDAAG